MGVVCTIEDKRKPPLSDACWPVSISLLGSMACHSEHGRGRDKDNISIGVSATAVETR